MYKAAVFCSGHVESGCHHGEAYSKLNSEEKKAFDLLINGHINEDGSFTTEMKHSNKDILIIRHAESLNNIRSTDHLDSDLSNHGEYQAHITSDYIKSFDLSGYVGLTSPMLRCLKTARYIQRKTGLKFKICTELCEVSWVFPEDGLSIRVMADMFSDMDWSGLTQEETLHLPKETDASFVQKLSGFLNQLSAKSVIVTHGTCVMTLIELSLGAKVAKVPEWDGSIKNASLSMVTDGTLQYLSKVVY